MFVGHFGVAFAAKRLAPRTSLGLLTGATLLPDLLWPIFLLAGLERVRIDPGNTAFTPLEFVSYPFSHSLLATLGWAGLAALLYWAWFRYAAGTLAVGLAVASHWVLDAVTHRPDLPLSPGGVKVGLGLWNSVRATVAVEGLLFAVGVWIYSHATRPTDRTGRNAFAGYVALLVVLYAANMFSAPPSLAVLEAVSVLGWMFPVVAWWVDRHRAVRPNFR